MKTTTTTIEKKLSKKFTFEKFTFAKLDNTKTIIGGGGSNNNGGGSDNSSLGSENAGN